MKLFAVIRTRGGAWRPGTPLEGQADWEDHASFMNALQKEGFVVLGGPLDGSPDVLLIVRANTLKEVVPTSGRRSLDPPGSSPREPNFAVDT